MMIPFLFGILTPIRAPMTYFLLAMNLLVFVATYGDYEKADSRLDALIENDAFMDTQGWAFAELIVHEPQFFSQTLQTMAERLPASEAKDRRLLGSLALRNSRFMREAPQIKFHGDQIAIQKWQENFSELRRIQDSHPSYQWGVSNLKSGWIQWISYQFSHSGFGHLFWNMLFLMIFGCFVEATFGGSVVILTYLGAGVAGALMFSALSGLSASPLVGASAAISGLIGLVAFSGKTKKINYFYWLLPIRGYFGFVILPAWLVIIVSICPDLSGYLSSSADFGSVAYSAHIGGTAFGAVLALFIFKSWLIIPNHTTPDSAI
jgi:membrane associated rhomboid family serine protease